MSSSIPNAPQKLKPTYPPPNLSSSSSSSSSSSAPPKEESESRQTRNLIHALNMTPHIEGGYFAEIDRNPHVIPNPFLSDHDSSSTTAEEARTAQTPLSGNDNIRNASTSIYYLLTPDRPQGHFHRNKGRTVHTVIQGRGRYVIIHADDEGEAGEGEGEMKRIETFVVGTDVSKGERMVWIVEGGKYKASFLLDGSGEGEGDGDGTGEGNGNREEDRLLISETVIPGFEYSDHDFLTLEKFKTLVSRDQADELEWLVRRT
ncbi:hypothetical protein NX059_011172 [Plenodomus lindquistii]|nr:hypothetical protein NX059_011172 [Plenodomus lindquistii]